MPIITIKQSPGRSREQGESGAGVHSFTLCQESGAGVHSFTLR